MTKILILMTSITLSISTAFARPADDLQMFIEDLKDGKSASIAFTKHLLPVGWNLINTMIDSEISSGWKNDKREQFKNELAHSLARLSSTCTPQEVLEILNKEIDSLDFNVVALYSLWTQATLSSMAQESDVFDQTIELAELINPTLAKRLDKELRPQHRSCLKAVAFNPVKTGNQCRVKNGIKALNDSPDAYLMKVIEANF